MEYLVRTDMHRLTRIDDVILHTQVVARGEPSTLAKLTIVGDIALGHNTQDTSLLQHKRTVIQGTAHIDGSTYYVYIVIHPGSLGKASYSLLALPQQRLLREEVATSITRDAQFGEDSHLGTLLMGTMRQGDELLYIIFRVGHADQGYGSTHFDESVLHNISDL